MSILKKLANRSEKGQSLVELALILPIIVVILASTVEVSNILLTKNRVETAARSAARHASNGGDDAYIVALNSVTQTLELTPDVWDIWTVEAQVNGDGTGFDAGDWVVNHVYGIGHTTSYTEVSNRIAESCLSDCISTRLLQDLQRDSETNENIPLAADLDVVGVFITHDINSILGLNAVPAYQGFTSVQGLGVMEVASQSIVDTTEGCGVVFPIGVARGIRSVRPSEYNTFKSQMTYPATPPSYYSFSYHNENIPLEVATDGDIFRFSFDQVNAAWLRWNEYLTSNETNLAGSLAWPGNSSNYNSPCTGCSGAPLDPYPNPVWGFAEAGDANNKSMHVNNRVAANLNASLSGLVTVPLEDHIDNGRALRLPIFEENFAVQYLASGTPYYVIREFGIFRVRGYSSSNNWLLLEFIRKDTSCGN